MEFKATATFAQAFKRLRKRYRNLPQDIERLRLILTKNSTAGIPLGAGLYKIRLSSSDMKKDKRGSFRIAYYLVLNEETIVFLDLYTKAEKEDVPVSQLRKILEEFLK